MNFLTLERHFQLLEPISRLGTKNSASVESRERENEAKTEAAEANQRASEGTEELKRALEEKGRFQNEATRVEETKLVLLDRDTQIQGQSRTNTSSIFRIIAIELTPL